MGKPSAYRFQSPSRFLDSQHHRVVLYKNMLQERVLDIVRSIGENKYTHAMRRDLCKIHKVTHAMPDWLKVPIISFLNQRLKRIDQLRWVLKSEYINDEFDTLAAKLSDHMSKAQ